MSTAKLHWRQLAAMLETRGISLVFDVGANSGQYVGYLRGAGWSGRIVSFEPQEHVHTGLSRLSATDPAWTVAPPMALGAEAGEAVLHVSAESDMSSLREMRSDFLATSPTSREVARERVPVKPLDDVFDSYASSGDRVFLKIDTQGSEMAVLDGARARLPGIAGLQLELSLVPLYEGEPGYREVLDRVHELGFAPYLVIPGYYSRHLGRMLQFDAVFFREGTESR